MTSLEAFQLNLDLTNLGGATGPPQSRRFVPAASSLFHWDSKGPFCSVWRTFTGLLQSESALTPPFVFEFERKKILHL